jgi:hypothetical protein
MTKLSFEDNEAFQLSDTLIEKPGLWSQSVPVSSDSPVLSFVKFRAFDRAVTQYRSIVHLLKLGQWEDALILLRSLYELNMNLSEIDCSSDREEATKKFVRFGKFQELRLKQRGFEDQQRDESFKPNPSVQAIAECKQKLATLGSLLNRDFAEFRDKHRWQESWSGVSVETLAQRLAKKTGSRHGDDYYVFRLGSLFTHNAPGSLLLGLREPKAPAWQEFRATLDNAGRSGLTQFLYEASICFVDIVGIAGDSIAGYERQWVDDALRLLEKFAGEKN